MCGNELFVKLWNTLTNFFIKYFEIGHKCIILDFMLVKFDRIEGILWKSLQIRGFSFLQNIERISVGNKTCYELISWSLDKEWWLKPILENQKQSPWDLRLALNVYKIKFLIEI